MDVFLCGFSFIILGIIICFHPILHNPWYQHTFDFTDYNIPFGSALIIFGVLAIWSEIRRRNRRRRDKLKDGPKTPPSKEET